MKENPAKSYRALPDDVSESKARLISASPYRATVMVTENNNDDSFDRDGTLNDVSPMEQFKKSRKSPIRDDSIIMREKGDEFLNSFTHGNFQAPDFKPVHDNHSDNANIRKQQSQLFHDVH